MRGRLIAVEGLDGSGKATQAQRLTEVLRSSGLSVRELSFPNYASESSALVRMYLSGAFGSRPDAVNAWAASSFYAADRYAGMKTDWGGFYESGGILIADRYTTSNAVHQCCKLDPAAWDGYLDWLNDFEYGKLGLPEPDLVIYLRLDVASGQRLMLERYRGDAGRKDIHEGDTEYLSRARRAADYCAGKYGWHTVNCQDPEGNLRGIDEIADEVFAAVRPLLAG